ncbi:MAG: SPFH domain-containing protein [Kiritimatiellia bacterium]
MTDTPPPIPRRRSAQAQKSFPWKSMIIGPPLLGLLAALPILFWFTCRIEPGEGKIAILIRKTGEDLPSGQILALTPDQKGIQLEVLSEGRYFKNPYTWAWQIDQITDIPAGKLGVRTRLFGKDLENGKILAEEGTKGILPEVLMPGKHRVNPYAYHVELFDAITVRAGHVGVITSLVGDDMLSSPGSGGETKTNTFLVGDGNKGVIAAVKDPGTYYLNPYLYSLVEVNLQGQRFEMSGEDRISFLTEDGFTVEVEGTIEFALRRDSAALLSHRVGDMDDIIKKIILPRARGFSRIEGSKHPAINFIVGQTRQGFQNDLDQYLRDRCADLGVEIRSVLVRKIQPPDQIAAINRDREVAVREAEKYEQQITQARSRAELVRQEMLALQNKEKVESDTERIRAVINAQQALEVQLIAARRDLDVATIQLEAARFEADAMLLKADGERDAVKADNQAQEAVFAAEAAALGSGQNLARLVLVQHLAPRIETILSNDRGGVLGELFQAFMNGKGEVKQ